MPIRMDYQENETKKGLNLPISRRELFEVAGKATIIVGFILGFGGIVRFFGQKDKFIRPPGALPEGEFLSLCIKCQKCQEVCPTGTITPITITEDIASFGTPKLDFRLGYCNLCIKCIEVCPTGALQSIEEEEVILGVAQVDKEICVAFTGGGCTKCLKECPYEAITLDSSQRPIVDATQCNGCGLCEYICPSSSLRAYTGARVKGIVVVPVGIAQMEKS